MIDLNLDTKDFKYDGKLIIGTAFYENRAWVPYLQSLFKTFIVLHNLGIKYDYVTIQGDSYVQRAKNKICQSFIDCKEATDLIIIDSDMEWNPEGVISLLMNPYAIAGGDYQMKNNWGKYCSIIYTDDNGFPSMADDKKSIKAKSIPGGFLRYKREPLERMRDRDSFNNYRGTPDINGEMIHSWFECIVKDNMFVGEDNYFFYKLQSLYPSTIPSVVVPDIDLTHHGFKGWDGNFHKYLMEQSKKPHKLYDPLITKSLDSIDDIINKHMENVHGHHLSVAEQQDVANA